MRYCTGNNLKRENNFQTNTQEFNPKNQKLSHRYHQHNIHISTNKSSEFEPKLYAKEKGNENTE